MHIRVWPAIAAALVALVIVVACIPTAFEGPDATVLRPTASPPGAIATASPTPAPSGRPSFVRPTPTPQPTFLAYVVKRGDTLTSIATAYRTTARSIAFWNRAQHPSLDPDSTTYSPNRIEVGWILLLVPDVDVDPEDVPAEPTPSSSPSATTT